MKFVAMAILGPLSLTFNGNQFLLKDKSVLKINESRTDV